MVFGRPSLLCAHSPHKAPSALSARAGLWGRMSSAAGEVPAKNTNPEITCLSFAEFEGHDDKCLTDKPNVYFSGDIKAAWSKVGSAVGVVSIGIA